VSQNYSLKLMGENIIDGNDGFSYWRLNVAPLNINIGSSLIFKS